MNVFPGCAGSVSIPTLSRASIPEMGQKCDQFHAFAGVILRYPGENAILSDKGRIQLKKQKRFQCHAILSEKSIALTAPRIVAIYLGNSDYFIINDMLILLFIDIYTPISSKKTGPVSMPVCRKRREA